MTDQNPTLSSFCDEAWIATAELREAIHRHPFNQKLASGELERDRFVFYLVQDARYLAGFSRALAVASARATSPEDAVFLVQSSHNALVVERGLHAGYLARYGAVSEGDAIPTSPSCLAYTSYLQAAALTEPFPVLAAALLPCFWIYQDVGASIQKRTGDNRTHPYRHWIETYADEKFAAAVITMRDLTDRAAASTGMTGRHSMLRAFSRAVEYEWMFWDSAWRKEEWPTASWAPEQKRPL